MNAERLLAHYECIADAADAIPRVRQFVIDLAVRGKLVPQDPNDEPASELLKRIAKEKVRLVNEGKAKRHEPLPELDLDQAPFELPFGWTWGRFPELGTFGRGKSKHRPRNDPALFDSGTHLMIQTGDVARSQGIIQTHTNKYNDFGLSQSFKWPKGTLCITIAANIADSGILSFDACFPDSVVGFVPAAMFDNARYFEYFMRTAKANLLEFAPATAQKNINLEILSSVLIPLPPLAEQHRIVAKVDELMALCDRLEAARAEREATRNRLTSASLARINAPDPETFRDDARFALDALPALTARPDQIKQLRQTILNLAVRGKLVPQDPDDEPASELLKRIATERADLVKQKEIRREEPLDLIQASELPFSVQQRWIWSRIGDAVLFTQYGTSQKSYPSEKGVPVLTMGNVQDGLVVCSNEKRIPETSEDLPALSLRKFDLLYNRTNSAELVGKTGIYLGDDGARTFASYLIRLRPSLQWTNPRFVNMAMNTPEFRETQIIPLIKKQTGQANVNGTALKNMLIPLPPLAEQHRIVAKVDALMALCDQMEASLDHTAATRRRLLDAVLAEALAPIVRRDAA